MQDATAQLTRARSVPGEFEPGILLGASPPVPGTAVPLRHVPAEPVQALIEGVYREEIRLEPMAGGEQAFDLVAVLTLERPDPHDGSTNPAPKLRSTLLSNVAAVAFHYFGRPDAESDNWQWLDTWSTSERLPRIVRIDVKFQTGDPQVWHRIEIPLNLAE